MNLSKVYAMSIATIISGLSLAYGAMGLIYSSILPWELVIFCVSLALSSTISLTLLWRSFSKGKPEEKRYFYLNSVGLITIFVLGSFDTGLVSEMEIILIGMVCLCAAVSCYCFHILLKGSA